jgi:hypothetical protein
VIGTNDICFRPVDFVFVSKPIEYTNNPRAQYGKIISELIQYRISFRLAGIKIKKGIQQTEDQGNSKNIKIQM